MLQRDDKIVQALRIRFTNVHPLLFHRSIERATTNGNLFDILDTIPEFPIVWNDDIGRWESTDLLQARSFEKKALLCYQG